MPDLRRKIFDNRILKLYCTKPLHRDMDNGTMLTDTMQKLRDAPAQLLVRDIAEMSGLTIRDVNRLIKELEIKPKSYQPEYSREDARRIFTELFTPPKDISNARLPSVIQNPRTPATPQIRWHGDDYKATYHSRRENNRAPVVE